MTTQTHVRIGDTIVDNALLTIHRGSHEEQIEVANVEHAVSEYLQLLPLIGTDFDGLTLTADFDGKPLEFDGIDVCWYPLD